MIEGVRNLLSKCTIVRGEDKLSRQANENATTLFQCHVRSMLCTKAVTETHRLSEEAFEWLLGEIEAKFMQVSAKERICSQNIALKLTFLGLCKKGTVFVTG